MKRFFLLLLIVFLLAFTGSYFVSANDLDDITKELNALKEDLKNKEANSQRLSQQLEGIKSRVAFIERDVVVKEQQVKRGEKVLSYQRSLLNERVRSFYKNASKNSFSLLNLLVSENLSESLRNFFYQKTLTDEDKKTIIKIVLYIKDIEIKKKNLESERSRLAVLKEEVNKQAQVLGTEISSTKQKVAQLSARQQQLVAQKRSSLNIPRSAAASALYCTDDRNLDPKFGTGFAFFTFGIPHRVGMSQYGAYGRATKSGQNYKDILNAYFQNISIECRDLPGQISVQGFGSVPFEDYVKGVVNKEMGADISEALKAQAVAARSYAIAVTDNGQREICSSQSCQVYSSARRGAADDAVNQTGEGACGGGKGEAIIHGGQVVQAWFASTAGGYTHTSDEVWGGNRPWTKNFADVEGGSVGSFEDLFSKAYDRDSKCFYTAQGYRDEYGKSAWLKPEEVADIVNVILLGQYEPSASPDLYQSDKGGWDVEKVKSELRKYRTPFNSIHSVSVGADFGSGRTTSVSVSGDAGSETFDGANFKEWFNSRAPANIYIAGPLYKVEKR